MMKIESQISPLSRTQQTKKTEADKSGSFQQVLSEQATAKKAGDSITIYSQGAISEEAAAAAPALAILPTDSTVVKLEKLRAIAENADYTGMSYSEIYKTIWDRYQAAFDGNMTAITGSSAGPASWAAISYQFSTEVHQNIVNPRMWEIRGSIGADYDRSAAQTEAYATLREARMKALGYEGMNFDEIESAIAQKYQGKNSTLDFLNRQGELYVTGCLDNKMGEMGASSYQNMIKFLFEVNYNPQSVYGPRGAEDSAVHMTDEQWQRVANQPFDTKVLAGEMRDLLTRMSWSGYSSNIEAVILAAIEQFALKKD